MKQLILHPEIHKFDTFSEFCSEFKICGQDIIVTSKPIYETYLEKYIKKYPVFLYEDYASGEPSDETFLKLYEDVKKVNYSRVIAIGGGSVIDMSKLLALETVEPLSELFDRRIELKREKKLIAVPTTCGTGSEATGISILEFVKRKVKIGLAADELFADYAVLIPELVSTLPYRFFATGAIDALVHAVESYVNPLSTPFTQMISERSIQLIINGFKQIEKDGEEARIDYLDDFLVAACLGGIAISNANTGAVHAMSYPFSGAFHVPHGEANAIFFVMVFRKYFELDPRNEKMIQITNILAKELKCAYEETYDALNDLLDEIISLKSLREYGMKKEQEAEFTRLVIETQQRLMQNTPVKMEYEDVYDVYQSLY